MKCSSVSEKNFVILTTQTFVQTVDEYVQTDIPIDSTKDNTINYRILYNALPTPEFFWKKEGKNISKEITNIKRGIMWVSKLEYSSLFLFTWVIKIMTCYSIPMASMYKVIIVQYDFPPSVTDNVVKVQDNHSSVWVSTVCYSEAENCIFLAISFPQRKDAGIYTLVASVPGATTNISVELIVNCRLEFCALYYYHVVIGKITLAWEFVTLS